MREHRLEDSKDSDALGSQVDQMIERGMRAASKREELGESLRFSHNEKIVSCPRR
jgi:hypothetical protein